MPTLNPRITITLTPAVAAVLKEMSQLTGNSQSAIVGDLLQSSQPVLERIVLTLRAASTIQQEAAKEIASGMHRAQTKLEKQFDLALGTMDEGIRPLLEEAEKIKRRSGRAGGGVALAAPVPARSARAGSTPVPVTRGSGPQPGGPKGKGKGVNRGRV
jgi:hypothetical protein